MGALVINGHKVAGVNIEIKPEIYSTEEREVGVWTDGKPLYQKTLEFDVADLSAGENEIRDIFDIPIDSLVNSTGSYFKENWGGPVPGYHSNSAWAVSVYNVYKKGLWIYIGNSVYSTLSSSGKIFVTLRYTKTTDQPGAGTWTTEGVYAHHYSTDEKVIGTWIDGKTLYEKTIDFGTLPNASTKNVSHNINDIDHIWIVDGFAENPNNGFTNQLNLSGTGYVEDQWYFGVNKTEIRCTTNSDRSVYTICYVTVRYTKSS